MEGASSSKLNCAEEELAELAKLRLEILNAQQSLNKSQETTNNLLKAELLDKIDETNLKNINVLQENNKVVNDLQSEIKEAELKIVNLEQKIIDCNEIKNLTGELKGLKDQLISLERERDQENTETINQEMSAIKQEYKMKTLQETKDFEQSLKLVKNYELKEKRCQRSIKENDLLMITRECDRLKEQVNRHQKIEELLSILSALKNKEPIKRSSEGSKEEPDLRLKLKKLRKIKKKPEDKNKK